MKKLSVLALAASACLAFASCEPAVFSMMLDMRKPSKSGIDLSGKTISVVYMDDLSGRDTVFNAMVAEGFAKALENDYFDGNEAINIYRMEKDMAGDYSSRDTLVNAAMMSGDDVIFLFDSPEFSAVDLSDRTEVTNQDDPQRNIMMTAKVPFRMSMYAYNTMGQDTVRVFHGSSTISQPVLCGRDESDEDVRYALWQDLGQAGERTGTRSAANFLSNWEASTHYFYYYEYGDKWMEASDAALECRWHDAIDAWIGLLDTRNLTKRAAAEYDIALAFYLLGDYRMSSAWLEQSLADCNLTLAGILRKELEKKSI